LIQPFTFARPPRTMFGAGLMRDTGAVVAGFGKRALLVTGSRSLEASGRLDELLSMLAAQGVCWERVTVSGEPTPELVDEAVSAHAGAEVVLAVGGGSAIDAGKAISAMLPSGWSVVDFLERVGTGAEHDGRKVPFVAVPTTSGTGSEATKNAVLSRVGPHGFKVSLRHDNFVPEVAIVDPELTLGCPPELTAACGMDAFTQLLESYVSTAASPLTDALALSGIESVGDSLISAYRDGGDLEARTGMAYASLLSGITLTNAGLGVIHGFAAALGSLFDVPHGVACGTLLWAATRANIEALQVSGSLEQLKKYATVGAVLAGARSAGIARGCRRLLDIMHAWTADLHMPRFEEYGVRAVDIPRIVEGTELKSNPARLDERTLGRILEERL